MKSLSYFTIIMLSFLIPFYSCKKKEIVPEQSIIFLHHSTGERIWYGKKVSLFTRVLDKLSDRIADIFGQKPVLPILFENYNRESGKNYVINEIEFPKASPYGWNNNPFDYYNIWVRNAGEDPYMDEPTLEILTNKYNVIILKHCYPVTRIKPDLDSADINSNIKTLANYKLQYLALREKMQSFPDTKFILFTGAALVKAHLPEDEALRAKEFFNWVVNEWDVPQDNIYIWDLYSLETEGDLYFKEEYAMSPFDSHPNGIFAEKASMLLFNRIIDVIENNGERTKLTGEWIQ